MQGIIFILCSCDDVKFIFYQQHTDWYLPSLVNNIVNDVFVFFFQLAEFEDGGLALRLICSHLLADPTSATIYVP